MKIVTKVRSEDWVAMVSTDRSIWEAGRTEAEAIGKLVITVSRRSDSPDLREKMYKVPAGAQV